MKEALATGDGYRAAFQRLDTSPSPPWLRSLRRAAFQRFETIGFPTPRQEEWKYTDLAPHLDQAFQVPEPAKTSLSRGQLAHLQVPRLDAHQLVFVNGIYAPDLSTLRELPRTVRVQSLAASLEKNPDALEPHLAQYAQFENDGLVALNTALFQDGAYIEIPRGVLITTPLHLVHVATGNDPSAHFPRILVRAGAASQSTIIESFVGVAKAPYVVDAVTELHADASAVVQHYKLQREADQAVHLHKVHIEQERQSTVGDHHVALGARLARTDTEARFNGEGGDLTLNGLYVLDGAQHVDNRTQVDHAQPRCTSREYYKGILDGRSRGVFFGKVFVRKDAQKTNASQTNKNLLLSEGALVDSTPALEINADDVKCSHGSTIGQLEKDALFYLRSRGIDEPTARSLLTFAFARDVLTALPLEPVRSHLEALLLSRLPSGRAVQEALHDVPT